MDEDNSSHHHHDNHQSQHSMLSHSAPVSNDISSFNSSSGTNDSNSTTTTAPSNSIDIQMTGLQITESSSVDDHEDQDNDLHNKKPSERPKPPRLPPPTLSYENSNDIIYDGNTIKKCDEDNSDNETPIKPTGPPPTYIPICARVNGEMIDDSDSDDDVLIVDKEVQDTGDVGKEPAPKFKGGILIHKSSVRDPGRAVKHVTFAKLPRSNNDPEPCLLFIILIIFLIAVSALILVILVMKGSLKVSCEGCRYSDEKNLKKSCPIGWFRRRDSCYGIPFSGSYNYSHVMDLCSQFGGYVVSLENQDENHWFVNNIVKQRDKYKREGKNVFIGINTSQNGNTIWSSSHPYGSFKNNLEGTNLSEETCYSVHPNATWLLTDCSSKLTPFCERLAY